MSLTNLDMTDRELLFVVRGCISSEGWTTSEDVADALGIRKWSNGRSPAGQVSGRLSWMARPDRMLLERLDPKVFGRLAKERLWRITPYGDEILRGRLAKQTERAIGSASAGSAVLMMRELVLRSFVDAEDWQATAVRREYLHNIARRRR